MKQIILIIALLCTVISFGQEHNGFNYKENKENVVASAIEGSWQYKNFKTNEKIVFSKDLSVLKVLAKYAKGFEKSTIYHAGYMQIFSTDDQKKKQYPYLLIETDGNMRLVYFRERDGDPIGDIESFILFIAVGEEKERDRLFTGGDFNNQGFTEFERAD